MNGSLRTGLTRRRPVPSSMSAVARRETEAAGLLVDLKNAAAMQRALLPRGDRSGAFFDVYGTMIPCRAIGGDSFDYVDLPSGDFGFAVCDVAGKGVAAALLSGVVQGIFFAESRRGERPAPTLQRVSQELVRRAIDSRFATMFYGVLSRDGRLTYCNAGHNPPFLLRDHQLLRLDTGGVILGVFDRTAYQEETVQLEPGDLLVVFSDGIPDALSITGKEFGEDRLLSCVRSNQTAHPSRVIEALLTTLRRFCRGTSQTDDVTALAIRYVRPTQSEHAESESMRKVDGNGNYRHV
jgi:sigma-B regulation protein RsbU (phosphoserine phosphatase)